MRIKWVPRRHHHVHILCLRDIKLQHLVALVFDHFKAFWVLLYVTIQKVVVYMKQIVKKLTICFVSIAFMSFTFLKTLISISSLSHKTVDSYFVYPFHVYRLIVNLYWINKHSFSRFFWCIPSEIDSWKDAVSACKVWKHGNWDLESLDEDTSWYIFKGYCICNNVFYDSKGDWTWFDDSVHSEVAAVHHGDICFCFVPIDGGKELQKGALFFSDSGEAKVDFLFGEASYLLLLDLELFIELFNVVI